MIVCHWWRADTGMTSRLGTCATNIFVGNKFDKKTITFKAPLNG